MTQKDQSKIICIFTKILGGKTFSELLEKVVATELVGWDVSIVSYEKEDYKTYPTPALLKFSNSLDAAWRVFKKAKPIRGEGKNAVWFFSSYHLVLPFLYYLRGKRVIVSLDTTPSLALELNAKAARGLRKIVFSLKAKVSKYIFRFILKDVDYFLARTRWCANSLEKDYGVAPEKIAVTYMPVDLPDTFKRHNFMKKRSLNLLFVGNDFKRKGGEFLLELFGKGLSESFRLTILSNDDPRNYELPPNVYWVRGCNKNSAPSIYDYYEQSDIFIFPSLNDQLGLVLCEAVSCGMPVVARDVGAASELVIDGYNGFVLPYDSSYESWSEKLYYLSRNPRMLREFSNDSRDVASEKLNYKVFSATVVSAIHGSD